MVHMAEEGTLWEVNIGRRPRSARAVFCRPQSSTVADRLFFEGNIGQEGTVRRKAEAEFLRIGGARACRR